jgi:PIN domain nuclease of toxin-antitoxin system
MRYYLDTHIIIFLIFNAWDEFDAVVREIIDDPCNLLYASADAVRETLHLFKTGKIRNRDFKTATDIVNGIIDAGIEIRPLTVHHLRTYATMDLAPGHNDPIDHILIAQAMCERIPLISSDHKFQRYVSQGLDLVYNQR